MALAAETLGQGHLRVILRNPEDPGIQEEIGRATVETILHRALAQKALLKRQASFHDFKYPVSNQAPPVRLSTGIQQGGRAFSVVVIGADMVHQMDRVDLMLSIKHPPSIDRMTITLLQRVIVLALGAKTKDGPTGANFPLRRVTLLVLPEEAELLALADQIGQLQVSLRNSEDIDIEEERGRTTFRTVLTGERLRALRKSRTTTNPCGCVRNGREESGREEQVLIEVPEAPVLRLSK